MSNSDLSKQHVTSSIIGIDLGTTNSCVSVMKDGTPIVIENSEGERTTPSVVSYINKEMLVGSQAKSKMLTNPKNTIFASKRLIGRKFEDPEISKYIKGLPYETTSHCNGDIWFKIDDKKFSPSQIGAFVLLKMKDAAEKFLNSKVVKSVITVPAYFNDSQRQATKDAGKIAGLDVLRVINEPTAAALAYGLDKSTNGHIAVYDLGGGTFDISILEIDNGIFHVKATNGDTFLGGEDFDNQIVQFILSDFQNKNNIDLSNNLEAMARIKEAAERVKRELSVANTSLVDIPFICNDQTGSKHLSLQITRPQLEDIGRKILERTVLPCKRALADAKIDASDIKHVILVGGMTRMPYVRKIVKDIFGIEPSTDVNPDEAVAKGAALQAGVLEGAVNKVLLLDVAPLRLGIELLGGVFNRIIKRNTTIPFRESQVFSTSEDNQSEVDIRIYQGEREMVADNKFLGRVKLKNIPPAPRGVPKIEVSFESDANGIYKVTAQDSVTKEPQMIEIIPSSGLTEAEVQRMVTEAEEMKAEDELKKKRVEIKMDFEQVIRNMDSKKMNKSSSEHIKEIKEILEKPDFDTHAASEMIRGLSAV